MTLSDSIIQLNKYSSGKSPEDILVFLNKEYSGSIAFSTSFGLEDQVITDMIFRNDISIRVFTLDTGRLFPETYKVFSSTIEKYKKHIEVFFPKNREVEKLVTTKGPFSFYESVENRKECCYIRKVEPLERALNGISCWITGIRAEQSEVRTNLQLFEWDTKYNLIKYNPLLHWNLDEVKKYILEHNVPYNVLHDKGFVSIGCQPCTRAISPGEDFRAGRWWWENNSKKECGLHSH